MSKHLSWASRMTTWIWIYNSTRIYPWLCRVWYDIRRFLNTFIGPPPRTGWLHGQGSIFTWQCEARQDILRFPHTSAGPPPRTGWLHGQGTGSSQHLRPPSSHLNKLLGRNYLAKSYIFVYKKKECIQNLMISMWKEDNIITIKLCLYMYIHPQLFKYLSVQCEDPNRFTSWITFLPAALIK